MAAGATYTPIQTTTLGSAQASYTFSSIPSTYTDLIIVCNAKSAGTPTIRLGFNSDTGSNYSSTILYGDGSSAGSVRVSNETSMNIGGVVTEFGTTIINVMNYSNSTTYKTVIGDYRMVSAAYGEAGAKVGLWRNTAAISSITISTASSTFSIGSTFTLYGITAA